MPTETSAQNSGKDSRPNIVRPGAPGEPTTILPSGTRASLPAVSPKDIEFMQGMIMHHAQAVEITDMIAERTSDRDIIMLGERISRSQADEIAFMKRWLTFRGEKPLPTSGGHAGHDHGGHSASSSKPLMPGMLSPEQMRELRNTKGPEFDRLFLEGMIQHHEGALMMVKDLFDTSGAGQDAELFNFATDVDSGQRAEITTMQNLLKKRRTN
ncbi:DUF305 domain-containing protein [Leptolyngbya sp. 7M]|uniref:DUF305 domain-containing protein n=1 Tax=Leptolyngbya sp. 7M TaxID=2812896 RepID=UPI001B8C2E8B|nr:DUF305 domain-containing protein [Leptolyngbya sp. 7M]QYO67313.1 DUF305 domain-containing protein [Leptolyngbya sp. 7M]